MKTFGLVLSGGGVRALAHAGILKALEEHELRPSIISGTSGGALIGGLYASGVSPEEMKDFFKSTPLFKFSMFSFGKMGLVDSDKYPALFKKFITCQTFEELSIPLIVTATNLISGKATYFSQGKLIEPLIASSALPPYFSPVKIDKDLYCDGGLLNNFPIEPLKGKCEILIGSFVNPLGQVSEKELNSPIKFLQRIYNITLDGSYSRKFKKCDYIFLLQLNNIGVLDVKLIDNAFDYGYQQAFKQIDTLRRLISE
ncbi:MULTISPECIES: patatin-like phospholipase family protein [unclassified Capnocytophaga]|mgnify:CR=1 FL=1|jgi:phospholipase, patatin family|uniref:patatin-like phospholipase family protein n=1 Tax=unclassified Capnocytophaga TaxID=2640652 RepID=UPI000202E4B1|nr:MULTISPECIES: patatin-like phospholipase family protein [unclassified Capnocytophaga]EGD34836.1 alpha-beta hydrolase family esterase [Capnocytophaga sp. oral taxon 338 str. F0234]MEB3004574.1 patatin-like phospholipase family protein [Capnocytophaga sp. G2]